MYNAASPLRIRIAVAVVVLMACRAAVGIRLGVERRSADAALVRPGVAGGLVGGAHGDGVREDVVHVDPK